MEHELTFAADGIQVMAGRFSIPSGVQTEDMRGCTITMVTRSRWALGGPGTAPTITLTDPAITMSAAGCDDPSVNAPEHEVPPTHARSESRIYLNGDRLVIGPPLNISQQSDLPTRTDQTYRRVLR